MEEAVIGTCISSAGDLNGDCYSEVIVGVSDFSFSGEMVGGTFVYFGSVTGIYLDFETVLEGFLTYKNIVTSVSTDGDVNMD